MRRVVASAAQGLPSRTVVVGAPGTGKSTLLAEAVAGAPPTVAVLRAGASILLRDVPFGTLTAALRPLGPDALTEVLTRGQGAVDPGFPVIEGLLDLLEVAAARSPLLLVVDDLHWMDPDGLRLLLALIDRCATQPIALLVGSRPAEDRATDAVLSAISCSPGTVVELGPMTPAEVEELMGPAAAQQAATQGMDLAALVAAAGGNPLVLTEIRHALEAVAPEAIVHPLHPEPAGPAVGIGDVLPTSGQGRVLMPLLHRVQSLPEATTDLLVRLALLGGNAGDDLLARAVRRDVDITSAIGPALASGVVERTSGGVAFRHDMLRQAVALRLEESDRRAVHRELAARLEHAGAPATVVAEQALLGADGDDDVVAARLLRAAAELRSASVEAAAAWLERALQVVADPALRMQVTDALLEIQTWRRPAHAEDVARHALATEVDTVRRGVLRYRLAQSLIAQGRAEESLAQLRTGLAEAPPEMSARLQGDIALRTLHLGRVDEADAAADAVLADPGADPPARTAALCAKAMCMSWRADVPGARLALEEAMSLAVTSREARMLAPRLYRMILSAEHGPLQAFVVDSAQTAGELTAAGIPGFLGWVHSYGALARQRALTPHDARAELSVQASIADTSGVLAHAVLALGVDALVALDLGDVDRAAASVEAGRSMVRRSSLVGAVRLDLAAIRTAAVRGDHQAAWALARAGWVRATGAGAVADAILLAPDLARAGLAAGQEQTARALLAPGGWDSPPHARAIARWVGGLLDGDGARIVEAADLVGSTGDRWGQARALVDAAALDWDGASSAASEAAAMYRAGGAVGGLDALDALHAPGVLQAVDGRGGGDGHGAPDERAAPGRASTGGTAAGPWPARWGWAALTDREREVVALVAKGLTNQQIATRLGIGRRTVETHVAAALRRTGLSSRVQLAVRASASGGIDAGMA